MTAADDSMASGDRHEFFVEVGENYARLVVSCPYDWADQSRPCWPHREGDDGAYSLPDDPPQEVCTYQDWVDNTTIDEMVHGTRLLPLGPVETGWDAGQLIVYLNAGS